MLCDCQRKFQIPFFSICAQCQTCFKVYRNSKISTAICPVSQTQTRGGRKEEMNRTRIIFMHDSTGTAANIQASVEAQVIPKGNGIGLGMSQDCVEDSK